MITRSAGEINPIARWAIAVLGQLNNRGNHTLMFVGNSRQRLQEFHQPGHMGTESTLSGCVTFLLERRQCNHGCYRVILFVARRTSSLSPAGKNWWRAMACFNRCSTARNNPKYQESDMSSQPRMRAVLVGIRSIDQRFIDTNRHIDDMRDALRADMYRMEQFMDARLKHLEEDL